MQRGVALVMVLWITVLLTVIGGSFAFSMRNGALASRNAVSLAMNAELLAINRTQTGLLLHTAASAALLLILIDMIWKPGA